MAKRIFANRTAGKARIFKPVTLNGEYSAPPPAAKAASSAFIPIFARIRRNRK